MKLYPHNQRFLDQIKEQFEYYNKVAFVAATGTGKSYVTMGYIDYTLTNNPYSKVLIISPSNAIKDQWNKVLKEYSDSVDYITYHKFSQNMDLDDIAEYYDLIIFDELHRLGAKLWGQKTKMLFDILDEYVDVLGLTATSYRTDLNLDIAEEFFDITVVGYDIQSAIDDGVLNPYKYIPVLYNINETIQDIKETMDNMKIDSGDYRYELLDKLDFKASQYNIKDIVHRNLPYKDAKIVVFVDYIDTIDEAIELIQSIFGDSINIYTIHSKQSRKQNVLIIKDFENDNHLSCLITVNMLNEGVHIDKINTIFLLRKTKSPILYFQQIGRAFGSNSTEAYIFDFVSNYTNIFSFRQTGNITDENTKHKNKIYDNFFDNNSVQIVDKEALQILIDLSDIYHSLFSNDRFLWTPEKIAKMQELYDDGKTYQEIADYFGCKKFTISYPIWKYINKTRYMQWTPEKIAKMQELYDDGKTYQEIADYFGCKKQNICGVISRYINKTRCMQWTPENIEKLQELYDDGKTYQEIADYFGYKKGSIYNIVSRYINKTKYKQQWTPEKIAKMQELYDDGKTYQEIADYFGYKKGSIGVVISKYINKTRYKQQWTPENIEKLQELYDDGKTYQEIADYFGYKKGSIYNIVSRYINKK